MPRLFLRVFYDGSRFYGFQRQPDRETVEGKLLTVLAKILSLRSKQSIRDLQYAAASRTDRGVHALAQTIAFNIEYSLVENIEEIIAKINSELCSYGIIVWAYTIQNINYHPRYSALYREYIYVEPKHDITSCVFDLKTLNEYAKIFVGLHDFKYLSFKDKSGRSTIRQIYDIKVFEEYNYIIYRFIGASYSRGLVRNIVSCLKLLAEKRITIEDLKRVLLGIPVNHVKRAIKPAPPHNLILFNVVYPFSFRILNEYWHKVLEYIAEHKFIHVFNYLYQYFSLNPDGVLELL
ncbi:MAG TPA: tRNA pseudouridine(38-40) synthase TruA [Desulfurococcales archaeon]|nr:tRNA pseudouridine(38-40) synthase TruA [Desulfurococcales archaeon]